MITLIYVYIYTLILHCDSKPVFECPKQVAYGESANLTCRNIQGVVSVNTPKGKQVVSCTYGTCASLEVGTDVTSIDSSTVLLTIREIDREDEGEWTCLSGEAAKCSLHVYKLPSCKISSTSSLKGLTIGQDLPLNISLSDYYCKNSIVWNLHIGGSYHNITELRDQEETENITNRVVTYSPVVTSSLTGGLKLAFNCNNETLEISCSGVGEMKLRNAPFCLLTSDDNTDDLTTGSNLTVEAAIEEYPCTTGTEYALLSGSLMVTEFVKRNSFFYATFKIKPTYLKKLLHLKYTCNNVSATTRTVGVEILLSKGGSDQTSNNLVLCIGLPVGVILLATVLGILIAWQLKRRRSSRNDTPLYDVPNHDTNRYQDLIRNDDPRQQVQEIKTIPDVEYETPQEDPGTQNASNVQYESIDDIEQAAITGGSACKSEVQSGDINSQSENGNQEYLSAVFECP